MATRRFLTTASIITVLIGLVIAVAVLKSGPTGRATGQILDIEIQPRTEIVDTGSVLVDIRIADYLQPTELSLSFDGEIFATGEQVDGPFTVDTKALDDGEHQLSLCVADEEYGEDCAEAIFFVSKPTVDVLSFQAPEEIGRGSELVITVETEGPIDRIFADFSGFDSRFTDSDAQVHPTEAGWRISYDVPDDADGEERWHPVPMEFYGSDGSRFDFEGPRVFLASGPLLPIDAATGILKRETVTGNSDFTATAFVAGVDPTLTLVADAEVLLGVVVEGEDLDQASLLLSMDSYGGYLVVPVAGLEYARTGEPIQSGEPTGYEVRSYGVPVKLDATSAFAQNLDVGIIKTAMLDAGGKPSQGPSCHAMAQEPSPPQPAMHTVWGLGTYMLKAPNARWTTRSLAGVPYIIRDNQNNEVVKAEFSARGYYNIEIPVPTDPAKEPYTLEVLADSMTIHVLPDNWAGPHKYPVLTWFPSGSSRYRHDFEVGGFDAVPFHIYKNMRRGLLWTAAQGAPVRDVTVYWTLNQDASQWCGGASSCCNGTTIYIGGGAVNPDDWDTTIQLHELGHVIINETSDHNNPGLEHTAKHRSDPRLAYNEGLATYIGQSIAGHPWASDLVLWDMRFKRSVESMDGVDKGFEGQGPNHSEWCVASFLWDLEDGIDASQSDNISGWGTRIRRVMNTFAISPDVSRGWVGEIDTADFVFHLACADPNDRNLVNTLLTDRFELDWLDNPSFCGP